MSVADKIITIHTETKDGIKVEVREGPDANEFLDTLQLTPTKFVKEVTRKLKKNKKD